LHAELQKRLEVMGVNPMDESVFAETRIAQKQYAALLRYAQDPRGLPARLEHDRQAELISYQRGAAARVGMGIAKVVSLGIYHAPAVDPKTLEANLDEHRRIEKQASFLAAVARSSPQTEVVWNMDEVRRALDQLSATRVPARSAQVIQQIMRQTNDQETRELCQRALLSLNAAGLE